MPENMLHSRVCVLEEKVQALRVEHDDLYDCKVEEIRKLRDMQANYVHDTNEKFTQILDSINKQQGFLNGARWGAGILFTAFLGLIGGAWAVFTHFGGK